MSIRRIDGGFLTQKKNKRTNEKQQNVGVGLDQPAKNNKGITLIALIITIIVMLILVSVAIRSAINSGLFGHAKNAVGKWGEAQKQEEGIDINELINEYVDDDGVVEPDDINEWRWRVETAETALKPEYVGTITLLQYLGTKTEVVVPNSIGGIPVKVLGDGGRHTWNFASTIWPLDVDWGSTVDGECANTKLIRVSMSNGIEVINDYAFGSCRALCRIDLPSSLVDIGEGAFAWCTSLETVELPSATNSLGVLAFTESGIKTIKIPRSVSDVGSQIFQNCQIVNIYCEASEKPAGWASNWTWGMGTIGEVHWGVDLSSV